MDWMCSLSLFKFNYGLDNYDALNYILKQDLAATFVLLIIISLSILLLKNVLGFKFVGASEFLDVYNVYSGWAYLDDKHYYCLWKLNNTFVCISVFFLSAWFFS